MQHLLNTKCLALINWTSKDWHYVPNPCFLPFMRKMKHFLCVDHISMCSLFLDVFVKSFWIPSPQIERTAKWAPKINKYPIWNPDSKGIFTGAVPSPDVLQATPKPADQKIAWALGTPRGNPEFEGKNPWSILYISLEPNLYGSFNHSANQVVNDFELCKTRFEHVRCNPDVAPRRNCGSVAYFWNAMSVDFQYVDVYVIHDHHHFDKGGGGCWSLMKISGCDYPI